MSKTYRRKQDNGDYRWLLVDYTYNRAYILEKIHIEKTSEEGKKRLINYHSDAYKPFKEPGPHAYRNLYTERPQRRESKREIRKFMLDEEYEVLLNPKNKLEYWT